MYGKNDKYFRVEMNDTISIIIYYGPKYIFKWMKI